MPVTVRLVTESTISVIASFHRITLAFWASISIFDSRYWIVISRFTSPDLHASLHTIRPFKDGCHVTRVVTRGNFKNGRSIYDMLVAFRWRDCEKIRPRATIYIYNSNHNWTLFRTYRGSNGHSFDSNTCRHVDVPFCIDLTHVILLSLPHCWRYITCPRKLKARWPFLLRYCAFVGPYLSNFLVFSLIFMA